MFLKKINYPFSKSKRFLQSHIILIQNILSSFSAVNISIYVKVIVDKANAISSHSFLDAFWEIRYWNILILFGLIIIVVRSLLLSIPQKTFREISKSLIEKVLEAACASLKYHGGDTINLRAIVTIIDESGETRTTKFSYNVRPDPERVATFPVHFGVTGEAMMNKKVVARELPSNHIESYPESIRPSILSEIKAVLAAPIYLPDKRELGPVGILAFDSTDDFSKTSFGDRRIKDVAQAWGDIIGDILEVIY